MQKKLFFLLLSGITLSAAAQNVSPDQYAASITKEDLKKQLTIIAGPEMEGRETGTEGQRKAATYIASQFKAFGLLPAPGTDNYQQYYAIGYDTLLQSNLSVGGTSFVSGKDYIDEITINNNAVINAKQIVFVGYGISDEKYDDYTGKDVKGKLVVFFGGEPKQEGRYFISGTKSYSTWTYPGGLTKKITLAKQKGAAGAIVINAVLDTITANYARVAKKSSVRLIQPPAESINCITIAGGMAKTILADDFFAGAVAKAKKNELLNTEAFSKKIKIKYEYAEQKVTNNASNVAGYIEGSDKKDEYVILTGHYDHLGMRNGQIYYGADDDGSGTCAVIEMAEAFAKAKAAGNGPRRSIVFMTVSGEEKGLWGSEYYSDNPLFPLDKTTVDLNTDMIGRIDTERKTADSLNYVYVIGHNKLSSELVGINEAANTQYTGLILDYKYDDPNDPNRIYYRSDHYNFARKGIPILFFYDGMLQSDYHKTTDTIDKIYWDIYEKRARMIFYTAWQMANRDGMLKRDIPLN
ncbi:MAG: M28 family peptidase [Chitinophagaceae bacterium]